MRNYLTHLHDLSSSSKEREEIRNTLTHTFMLNDFATGTPSANTSCIDYAWTHTFEVCQKIYNPLDRVNSYFGTPKLNTEYNLSILPHNPAVIQNLIKHHCIIMSYITLRLYVASIPISGYQIANVIPRAGLDHILSKENQSTFSTDHDILKLIAHANQDNESDHNYFTIFKKVFPKGNQEKLTGKNERTAFTDDFSFIASKFIPEANGRAMDSPKPIPQRIPLSMIDYFDFFKLNIINTSHVTCYYSNTNYTTLSEKNMSPTKLAMRFLFNLQDLKKELLSGETRKLEKSDKIFLSFLFERTFNCDFISCLLQNMITFDTPYMFLRNIDKLVTCAKLPNVFSRHIFLQYIFDCHPSRIHPDMENNFFDKTIKPENREVISFYDDASHNPTHVQNDTWVNLVCEYVNYFSTIIFPVYTNYFLEQLLLTAEYSKLSLIELYRELTTLINNPTDPFNQYLHIDKSITTRSPGSLREQTNEERAENGTPLYYINPDYPLKKLSKKTHPFIKSYLDSLLPLLTDFNKSNSPFWAITRKYFSDQITNFQEKQIGYLNRSVLYDRTS